ncbi:MAG: SMC-Scp complex subunit ScpB [Hyphomicrobiales bacterium]|jgi:segregation and condensation protein B|nr:SMC-Scp complex subunit ScpB [Hyphomicrobiales bacterium]|tara:strand:+ start:504 stop:1118 length:615 start_codon:yes stop_codon:yes gene_type:complete
MKKNFLSNLSFKSNIKSVKGEHKFEFDDLYLIEAIVFASREPIHIDYLITKISQNNRTYLYDLLVKIKNHYQDRGVNFIYNDNYCVFKTSPLLKEALVDEFEETRDLSRAAKETLAIIAYHQPTTRAEIEEIRGVSSSKGSLDILLDCNWIEINGKKDIAGRPLLYKTTKKFLLDFNLGDINDLPNITELKREGLLSAYQDTQN